MTVFSRREFIGTGARCMAHVTLMSALAPAAARRLWARPAGTPVAQEAWGSLSRVAEGVWALVSTPLQDRTTLCNGGIIAGRAGVVVVESFASEAGAAWMAGQARRLTGRGPTHVVVTHYHGDHSGGLGAAGDAHLRVTTETRDRVRASDARRDSPPGPQRTAALDGAVLLDASTDTAIDLGDRTVRVVPRAGHTDSDVTVELDDPSVVFCGDLVWNEMFPNYVDARPSALSAAVRGLRRSAPTVYVPGHGPVADGAALDTYLRVLDHVEEEARRAWRAGVPAAEAAGEFALPAEVGEWFLFNPGYYERALGAWERELREG